MIWWLWLLVGVGLLIVELVTAGILYVFAPSAARRALREEVVVAEAVNE